MVNFTNILRAAFASIFLSKKLQSHIVTREKLLYKKTLKMLIKLTPVIGRSKEDRKKKSERKRK